VDDLTRTLDFMSRVENSCAERIEPFEWGAALFLDSLPKVHDFNFLRVEGAPADLVFDELIREAERLQGEAGLSHRKIVIEDDAVGRALAPLFRTRGWDAMSLQIMVYRGERKRVEAGDVVRELTSSEVRALWSASWATTRVGEDPEQLAQRLAVDTVLAKEANALFFGVVIEGLAVSSADLYSDGSIAQIESVLTLEAYRRRGFGGAVVLHALAHALDTGHELVFLVADIGDWPKEMYARMGFDPVGRYWDFTLTKA